MFRRLASRGIANIASHVNGAFIIATTDGDLLYEPSLTHYLNPWSAAPTMLLAQHVGRSPHVCAFGGYKFMACGTAATEVSIPHPKTTFLLTNKQSLPAVSISVSTVVGNWLIYVSQDVGYVLAMWLSQSERRTHQRLLPTMQCTCLDAKATTLAIGTANGLITIFSIGRAVFREVARFMGYLCLAITHVCVSNDMTVVASSEFTSDESRLNMYTRNSTRTCSQADITLDIMAPQSSIVTGIVSDGECAVTCASDGSVRVWHAAACIHVVHLQARCTCLAFVLSNTVAVGSDDGIVYLCAVPRKVDKRLNAVAEMYGIDKYILSFVS